MLAKSAHFLQVCCFHFRYKNYEFISDNEISKSAGLNSRYSDSSLHGVVFDIQMLAECDFLVCTFSSQVRLLNSFQTQKYIILKLFFVKFKKKTPCDMLPMRFHLNCNSMRFHTQTEK